MIKINFKVIIIDEAKEDIDNILMNSGNISSNYTEKILDEYEKLISILERNPYIFPKYKQNYFYKNLFRRARFLNYYIFYLIKNKEVIIVKILSCKQDYTQFNFLNF